MSKRQAAVCSILLVVAGCSSRDGAAGASGTGGSSGGRGGDVGADGGGCANVATNTCGTGLNCERRGGGDCVDPNWADWRMPNLQVDVADGAPNLESRVDNGDGTVTDLVTGLMWQQGVTSNAHAWSDAEAFCSALVLAGHTDWRLPSAIELVSIVDYGQSSASINGTFFPDTAASPFWSSSFGPTYAWKVDFADGGTSTDDVTRTYSVRCVRWAPSADASAPAARLTAAGGTVTDNQTGLIWQQATTQTMYSWADAKSYCASGGPDLPGLGWRLPTIRELQTLVDPARVADPRTDLTAFPSAPSAAFWSSSAVAGSPSAAWLVNFYDGFASKYDKTTMVDVRCVR